MGSISLLLLSPGNMNWIKMKWMLSLPSLLQMQGTDTPFYSCTLLELQLEAIPPSSQEPALEPSTQWQDCPITGGGRAPTCRGQKTTYRESVPSLYHMAPRDWTWVATLQFTHRALVFLSPSTQTGLLQAWTAAAVMAACCQGQLSSWWTPGSSFYFLSKSKEPGVADSNRAVQSYVLNEPADHRPPQ